MEASNQKNSKRSLVGIISTITGILVMFAKLVLSLKTSSSVENFVDLLFIIAFSIWTSLPFFALGQFRGFPNVTLILWIIGCFVILSLFKNVYFAPSGSTAGLAIVFIPLYLLVLYGIVGLVLLLLSRKSNGK